MKDTRLTVSQRMQALNNRKKRIFAQPAPKPFCKPEPCRAEYTDTDHQLEALADLILAGIRDSIVQQLKQATCTPELKQQAVELALAAAGGVKA